MIGRLGNATLAAISPDTKMHLKILIVFCYMKAEYLSDFDRKNVILRKTSVRV